MGRLNAARFRTSNRINLGEQSNSANFAGKSETAVFPHHPIFPKVRMRFLLFPLLALCAFAPLYSQNRPDPPKLIVGIVVDQMRYDYLYKYYDKYSEDGFKRLLREGFSFENAHFNYMPTYTAPGHAAIYTGTTPSVNGIISNEWWDPEWGQHRYVTADTTVQTVGAEGKVGQHAPRVLLSSTITDELRLSNDGRSKVVGICLKDRGSILPAGHIPNACFWFDDKGGNWITSTYYQDSLQLPDWVKAFNARRLPDLYMAQPWTPKFPLDSMPESFNGWSYKKRLGNNTGFPYDLPGMLKSSGNYGAIRYTPLGNRLTTDFALEALDAMQLGGDAYPDFLCLSYSSTDYCTHHFGVHAAETQDTYLRLDEDLARLLNILDQKFGKNQVLVFLTADHGGAETPQHLHDLQFPVGVFREGRMEKLLDSVLASIYLQPGKYVQEVNNQQVWLHTEGLLEAGIAPADAAEAIIEYLKAQPGVYDAFTAEYAQMLSADYPFISEIRRGLHPRRSGDILYLLDPAWHADDQSFLTAGTTHGSPYAYDTHVPLLWYGWRTPPGESRAPVSITDIAPTLAAMLRIMEPNGTTGKVIADW